jgi:hypothetical protein
MAVTPPDGARFDDIEDSKKYKTKDQCDHRGCEEGHGDGLAGDFVNDDATIIVNAQALFGSMDGPEGDERE